MISLETLATIAKTIGVILLMTGSFLILFRLRELDKDEDDRERARRLKREDIRKGIL